MALTLWTTFALVVWIVLWSLGAKAIDAGMLALLIIVIGATLHIVKRYLPNRQA
jgi:hypothetical protein